MCYVNHANLNILLNRAYYYFVNIDVGRRTQRIQNSICYVVRTQGLHTFHYCVGLGFTLESSARNK